VTSAQVLDEVARIKYTAVKYKSDQASDQLIPNIVDKTICLDGACFKNMWGSKFVVALSFLSNRCLFTNVYQKYIT
jgi:hypothetical protein